VQTEQPVHAQTPGLDTPKSPASDSRRSRIQVLR
jgi:hypothetical protein